MFAHEGSGRRVFVIIFMFGLYVAEAVVSKANWLVFFIYNGEWGRLKYHRTNVNL